VDKKYSMLIVGGSAGSLAKVLQLLPYLKKEMELSVVIVFHRKDTDDTMLVELLAKRTEFMVKEAEEKEVIRPNVIYIAPTDYHLLIEKDNTTILRK
jgi:two-component system, chemotaxis family, protein-glutamate methylesterase/glutaminase